MTFDTSSAALTALGPVVGPGHAVMVEADPSQKFLYSSDFNTGAVYAYAIDATSGNLSPLSGSPYRTPFSGNGGPIAIDPGGKFVFFVADANGDIVTFIRNSSDGTLTLSSAPAVQDANQPLSLLVDPSGKFVYAANHSDPSGNEVSVFAVDSAVGGLTSVPGSPFSFQANSELSGMAISSSGKYLYTALSNATAVAVLTVNISTGAIAPIANSQSLTTADPQQVLLHPSGKFLYTGNIGSISAFSVDANNGRLSGISGSPYNSVAPVALAIDPSGKYLFFSGFSGNFPTSLIAIWNIDESTGALSPHANLASQNGTPTATTVISLP